MMQKQHSKTKFVIIKFKFFVFMEYDPKIVEKKKNKEIEKFDSSLSMTTIYKKSNSFTDK